MTEETKKDSIMIEFKNPLLLIFLIFSIVVLALELSLIFNKPIAFGDGAYHAYISKFIGTNLSFPKILPELNGYYIYSPFLHLLLSVFYLASFGEILAKAFIPLLVFITGFGVFVTVSRLFSKKAAFVAGVLTITLPIFVTYSVLIYTDILMTLFFSLAVMFTLIAEKYGSKKYWLLAIVFAGLSYLSKGIGAMSFVFIGSVLFYKLIKRDFTFKNFTKFFVIVILITLLIVGGWFARNLILYKSLDCTLPLPGKENCVKDTIDPDLAKNFAGYVTPSGSNLDVLHFGLKGFMIFMYGNVWVVPLTLVIGTIFLLIKREKIDNFVLILIFVSILPALIIAYFGFKVNATQRAEDIARYLLLSSFTVPLVSAIFVDKFFESLKKYSKFVVPILLIIIIVMSWISMKDKLNTMSSVMQFSPSFFEACNFIKTNTVEDSKLLTLWAAPTAYNCERTAEWESNNLPDIVLSKNLTNVLDGLKKENISYIFIQKFALSQTPYQASIPIDFVAFLESNNKTFEKLFENGPTLTECVNSGGCDGTAVYKINY